MNNKLSYQQLYDKLENLNTDSYDSLIEGDFEKFQGIINNFIESGIPQQEEFALAREAYRFTSMPFTLNDMWIGVDSRNVLDDYIASAYGYFIHDLKLDNTYPFYASLTELEKIERAENKLIEKRIAALEHYKTLYKDLYSDIGPKTIFKKNPLVPNVSVHQKAYIDKVVALADARSKFFLTFNFSCSYIDNERLKKMKTIPEKMDYLTDKFPKLFQNGKFINGKDVSDYLTFNNKDEKILASNYLQGKGIERNNWKNYKKGKLPNLHLFYLELAFYLSIPSSDEVEKFMNLHGYSIKSPMTHFSDICFGSKIYHIMHQDLCRWIDAGIDYNLINDLCNMQLQQKEIRKK